MASPAVQTLSPLMDPRRLELMSDEALERLRPIPTPPTPSPAPQPPQPTPATSPQVRLRLLFWCSMAHLHL